ncbi:electron transfer flavoprotein subunit alpha/FixB family protein [Anaerosacchariphilus polymeriproducens]|uniref:Electron transfer flavoprotein subunit alpha/FixB family protein n=1 Tax=Anaerosacchariphilus polymeriproducens TaxID=1812858 RepID=A0A371ASN5_9FIRM|nr:electron transfer flavoprotein subunit alpha/FixB family protein [Anaerosacchariphilus polymeriproducens]RDU22575.1 electron transfer flavoprotein subunit alpha/FixB family protein [Anaerosacchariphilus polymeriproducens]
MNLQDYKGIFVFTQQVDCKITGVSFELIGKAKELASELETDVTAVVLGAGINTLAEELAAFGADKVIIVDNPELKDYTTEPYTQVMYEIIEHYKPEIVLYGATAIGRDLAPRVSARVHTGLTADCTKLEIDTETKDLRMTRPAFGGNIMATIVSPRHRPQMATVRPGVMQKRKKDPDAKALVEEFKIDLKPNQNYVEVVEIVKKVSDKIDIMDAKILVSGGRGVGCKENFKLLQEFAEVLNASLSSSRACVDAGWTEKEQQVGQTGKTVRPNVYFAIGISGAIQHLAGMEESDIIIAINKDESAPIFDVADYGIVGDYQKILPILTEKMKIELAVK